MFDTNNTYIVATYENRTHSQRASLIRDYQVILQRIGGYLGRENNNAKAFNRDFE